MNLIPAHRGTSKRSTDGQIERLRRQVGDGTRDISRLSAESRFEYVENLILLRHKETPSSKNIHKSFLATFDDWQSKVDGVIADVHKAITGYYSNLDFIERYSLSRCSWVTDKDIQALLQILQIRGRAKAAVKLEKFEAELRSLQSKISKVESGGRYYREDEIKVTASFDLVQVTVLIKNDRSRKRQERIDKMAQAPFKAAEKAYGCGCGVIAILFVVGLTVGVPILIILHILGVVK